MTSPSTADLEAPLPKTIFTEEDLALIDPEATPGHIAIIMDGNRRWAQQRGLPPLIGHWEGAEVLTDVVSAASELGIETVTVYSFSTENWSRSPVEVEALMDLFEQYLIRQRDLMVREGIKLDMIGDLSRFPDRVKNAFLQSKAATAHCSRVNLVLALNYGARDEIRRAMVKIFKSHEKGQLKAEDLTEDLISRNLDTAKWGDPDLMIRTSGELRVSNFLLWQISYAEIYITEKLWPDFTPKNLCEAVLAYQRRRRRLGG